MEGAANAGASIPQAAPAPVAAAAPAAPAVDTGGAGSSPSASESPRSESVGSNSNNSVSNNNNTNAGAKPPEAEVEFDWESWDGNHEVVPEPWRKPVEGAKNFFSKKYADYDKLKPTLAARDKEHSKLQKEFKELNELYESVLENYGEDPRLPEIQKVKETIESELLSTRTELETFRTEVKAWREKEAAQYADRIMEKFPKYFTEPSHMDKFSAMMDTGFDAEVAISILELGDAAVEAAKTAKAKGAPDNVAYDYAELSVRASKAKPERREAAKVMAGAEGAQNPAQAPRDLADARDHQERVNMVAKRMFKLHSGGR
jgi:ElaB/YqjD/DUF883 family membrane-anchored ribosome-binding protein